MYKIFALIGCYQNKQSKQLTAMEKLYSLKYADLIGYFGSKKYYKTIKGLNLITLYYSEIHGNLVPINSRIDDKK